MLTKVADRLPSSPAVVMILLAALPSAETRARTWFVAIFSLKPRLKVPGVYVTVTPFAPISEVPRTGAVAFVASKVASGSWTQEAAIRPTIPAKRMENIFFMSIIL